jgi:tRNA threonylcarbamoyl adenosine modification protein YjeE
VISEITETITLHGDAETAALGERLSLWARPGMLILLQGDLGSGKSTLARAFIRRLMKPESQTDIPSPTFSLIQTYDDTRVPVFHADLYRLNSRGEVDELGLDGLLGTHAGLVEWPERLTRTISKDVLHILLSGRGDRRTATLSAKGSWSAALQRDSHLRDFIASTNFNGAERVFFEGDASSRRYEKLMKTGGSFCLLMDMPQRPDGPPVRNGKPYSQIAHLAEGITAVTAINKHLVSLGYSAPQMPAVDLAKGFGLIEPLSFNVYGRMMLDGVDMREPLETAAAVLADMAQQHWPRHPEAAPGVTHTVQDYDQQAQLIEVDLLPSWFIPHARGVNATAEQLQSFEDVWRNILPLSVPDKPLWAIRDYHSPNLLWIPERVGLQRVGIIDSQDALMGHAAYDLVSMGQDARVDIAPELEAQIINHYCALRAKQGHFNRSDFETAYAILGAQRATKILGIFARLNYRDGKPAYLKHMPRVSRYLAKNVQHPALLPLKHWFETHIPEALAVKA